MKINIFIIYYQSIINNYRFLALNSKTKNSNCIIYHCIIIISSFNFCLIELSKTKTQNITYSQNPFKIIEFNLTSKLKQENKIKNIRFTFKFSTQICSEEEEENRFFLRIQIRNKKTSQSKALKKK